MDSGRWSGNNRSFGQDKTIFPTGRVMAPERCVAVGYVIEDKATRWSKIKDKTAADLVARGLLDESRVSEEVSKAAMVLRVESIDTDTEAGLKALISLMKSRPAETMEAVEKIKRKKKKR